MNRKTSFIITASLLISLGLLLFSCDKDQVGITHVAKPKNIELKNINAGLKHNDICKTLIESINDLKVDTLTVEMYDSIFLSYHDFTSIDLLKLRELIKTVDSCSLVEIYDKIRIKTTGLDRKYYMSADSILSDYNKCGDYVKAISNLNQLSQKAVLDKTLDTLSKYTVLVTLDLAAKSIEFWATDFGNIKYLNVLGSYIADMNTCHAMIQSYIYMGYDADQVTSLTDHIVAAAAYNSICVLFGFEINGRYPL